MSLELLVNHAGQRREAAAEERQQAAERRAAAAAAAAEERGAARGPRRFSWTRSLRQSAVSLSLALHRVVSLKHGYNPAADPLSVL